MRKVGFNSLFNFVALSLSLCSSISSACPVLASPVVAHPSPASVPVAHTIADTRNSSINYNLSSTKHSVSASPVISNTANIQVGNSTLTVTPTALLTPAELVAVSQVVSSGHQQLLLNALGAAVGGTFNVVTDLQKNIGNLVIPRNITAVDVVNSKSNLILNGNLQNAGNLLFVAGNGSGAASASLSAVNIDNLSNATISSFANNTKPVYSPQIDLTLSAQANIHNMGTISSGGSLTLNADNSIINQRASSSGDLSSAASISATNNVTLNRELSQS